MSETTFEEDDLGWCHIYSQYANHSPALIQGNRIALKAIRDAIDRALQTGMDGHSESIFTADGEGYGVTVQIRNLKFLEGRPLPYAAPWAGGVGQREFEQELENQKQLEKQVAESKAKKFAQPEQTTRTHAEMTAACDKIIAEYEEKIANDDWECTECGYDKQESGGLPPPKICPLCAGDTGRDGNIIWKRKQKLNR